MLPQCQELLVSRPSFGRVPLQLQGAAEAEMRQCTGNGLVNYNAWRGDYFLELDCRLTTLVWGSQVGFPANIKTG